MRENLAVTVYADHQRGLDRAMRQHSDEDKRVDETPLVRWKKSDDALHDPPQSNCDGMRVLRRRVNRRPADRPGARDHGFEIVATEQSPQFDIGGEDLEREAHAIECPESLAARNDAPLARVRRTFAVMLHAWGVPRPVPPDTPSRSEFPRCHHGIDRMSR